MKAVSGGGGRVEGGRVLWDATSRGLLYSIHEYE